MIYGSGCVRSVGVKPDSIGQEPCRLLRLVKSFKTGRDKLVGMCAERSAYDGYYQSDDNTWRDHLPES